MERVISALPIVECKAEAFTEGESTITKTDVVSLKFTITYVNFPIEQAPGYLHSNAFPFVKRQSWYLIITDGANKEMVVLVTKMDFKDKDGKDTNSAIFELKQQFGKAG